MTITPVPARYVAHSEAIRAIRQAMGYNTTQLAKAVGISQSYMSRIELGQCSASPQVLKRIAEALRVPVAAITTIQAPGGTG